MKKVIWIVVLVLVVIGLAWLIKTPGKSGRLDTFAQCLTESGAKYYAAFWCPNCKNQQAMFGRSARLLPRTECSTADAKGQLQVCKDANIQGYPTWEFADGTRETGTLSLEVLSERTNCPLPTE